MTNDEFKRDLEIDVNQLDVEAACQPERFFKWCELAVEAKAEVDRLKLRMEVTQAKLQAKIRLDPSAYQLPKITDAAVDMAVKRHPRYEAVYDTWIEARKNSAMLDQAVNAMEQRKRMIEVLITLHGQQYFAGPSVPRNLGEAWREARDKRSEKVAQITKAKARRRVGKDTS